MYEVYRLIVLDEYFYVYTDKGISSLREGLNPNLMVTSLNLEEARVVTTALLEDRWNITEELKVEHIDLGWNVYKFNRQGKPEYCASTKSITYFDVKLEPVIIANNISKFDADLIARALIAKIEVPQQEDKSVNTVKIIAVNVALDSNQRYVLMTTDKGEVIDVSMSDLSNNLSIETLTIEYLKNTIPFDYNIRGNELICKPAFKPNADNSRIKPKGIVPKELNDQRFICDRFYEICEAIVEFKRADVRIPKDWLNELDGMFLDSDTHDLLEKGIC